MSAEPFRIQLIDLEPAPADITAEAIAGLRGDPKTLPCKLFYDKRGSELFDAICELPEYYPTRTEIGIVRDNLEAIAAAVGPRVHLIELGSGSSTKTRILLDALDEPVAYAPIDISREHLLESAERLHHSYPDLEVQPVCADYTQPMEIPRPHVPPARRVVFFPGSTIGNFHAADARRFLDRIAEMAGPGGGLLVGVDLRKDREILVAAYDDEDGVTAEFNLNLLHRLNREANADFDVEQFEHRSVWNDSLGRIEMHLVSRVAQTAAIDGHVFEFAANEPVRTECAYKYRIDQFEQVAERFRVRKVWTDADRRFSVQYLVVNDDGRESRNADAGAGPKVI
jgi:dimethylhistidine N-methyltransferase